MQIFKNISKQFFIAHWSVVTFGGLALILYHKIFGKPLRSFHKIILVISAEICNKLIIILILFGTKRLEKHRGNISRNLKQMAYRKICF